MSSAFRLLAAAAAVALSTLSAAALDAPKGPVVLTVSGAIANTNGPNGAEFDMDMLNALQQRTTKTKTPWTEGVTDFAGPLGSALLDAVGAKGETLKVVALNDYSAEVPVADLREHAVIFATTMYGKPMSVRDKGPLFLIYPFDEEPELFSEVYFNRSVWQINRVEVK